MNYRQKILNSIIKPDGKVRIVEGDSVYDQRQIAEYTARYIEYIDNLHLEEGDRVALKACRDINWICFFFALQLCGVVPLLMDSTLDDITANELAAHYKLIFTNTIDDLGMILPLASTLTASSINLETFSLPQNTDLLFSCHTSGTTGKPKIVTYNTVNIEWVVQKYIDIYSLESAQVVMFALPFHYCYSIIPCCISPFIAGATVAVVPEGASTEQIISTIDRQKVNIMAVVPNIYNEMLRFDLSQYDFSSLRMCDSGGESIPISIVKLFLEKSGTLITEGYGLTETSSLTHFLLPDANGNMRLGSVGRALPDVLCRIVDADYNDMSVGMIGELLVKGPMVAQAYDNKRGAISDADGWFATEDLFYKDDDDFYYLISRKRDAGTASNTLVRMAAETIPPMIERADIEEIIHLFMANDELVIFIVPTNDANPEIVKQAIRDTLPLELQTLARVHLVGKLPRTATGKVLRGRL